MKPSISRRLRSSKNSGSLPKTTTRAARCPKRSVKTKELSKLKGVAFDRAYVDNEVTYHKLVDDTLENQLIPSASNGELKSLLKAALKTIQGHEQHAEQVAALLK